MVSQPEPVVTGDAVVLDIQIALLPVRALAALIDVVAILVFYLLGMVLWALAFTQLDDALTGPS